MGEKAGDIPGGQPHSRAAFPETDWSLILRPLEEGRPPTTEVLDRLCRDYLSPVYAYFRIALKIPHPEAEDLAHEFIAKIDHQVDHLKQRDEPRQVRFRDFLRSCARNFALNAIARQRSEKRGGTAEIVSIDPLAEKIAAPEPPTCDWHNAALALDREWAISLVQRARLALTNDYHRTGKDAELVALLPFLTAPVPNGGHAVVAAKLGISEDASKKRLERLRAQFAAHLRSIVRATVHDPAEVDDELRHLLRVWAATAEPMDPAGN